MADLRLGIDVGGTKSLVVAVDAAGEVTPDLARTRSRRVPTPRRTADQSALIAHLVGVIGDEVSAAARRRDRIVSVGIGMPGLVTRDGVLRAAPNLDGVGDLDVAGGVRASVGLPVSVDNDATCATVAEWALGAGRGVDDLVMVSLGTGIGGGIVSGGVLQRGAQGFAGEFGHMIVDPSGWECPCGRRGCWERYAAGTALPALLRADPTTGDTPSAGRGSEVTGRDVEDAARAGDPAAIAAFHTFAGWVAVGLANIANLFDPSRVVIGGGVSMASDLFLDETRRRLGHLVYQPERRRVPEVVLAEFGEHAAAVGAALIGADSGGQ